MSYGQNMRSTSGFSKPVETGKEYTVDVTDTGRSGDGIARIEGLVIFVKNGKAGAKNTKIKIVSVGSRFATAEVVATAGSTDTT
ncbi:MAG: TRAM domain-containing protein [Nitrososphaeraceae archaeon]